MNTEHDNTLLSILGKITDSLLLCLLYLLSCLPIITIGRQRQHFIIPRTKYSAVTGVIFGKNISGHGKRFLNRQPSAGLSLPGSVLCLDLTSM